MYQSSYYGTPQQPTQPQYPGYGYPTGGYVYAPRPAPHYTQPVTAELAKMLIQHNDELDIRISNAEKIRNWCTHKEPGTGRLALVDNGDGTVTCRTCGTTFRLINNEIIEKMAAEGKIKTIKDIQDLAIDALQTIKTMYVDIPEEFHKNYSQTISMLAKINDLYGRAVKNFGVYETYTGALMPNGMSNAPVNAFAMAANIMNGQWGMPFGPMGSAMPGYSYPQQPTMPGYPGAAMPGYPMAQPGAPAAGMPWNPAAPGGGVPQVDPATGNVYPPSAPAGPTTMGGQPMIPGYNPFMAGGVLSGPPAPGAMSAPATAAPAAAPQQPAPVTPAPAVDGIAMSEPTQTKQIVV